MSTAAELLDPKVFASVKAEFHEVFVQKREEVRKQRAEVRASKAARSGRDGHQTASKDGTLVGTKRPREGTGRPVRPLKRPRIIENVPNTSSAVTREQHLRNLWENHAFAELSPVGALRAVRKVSVREQMYEPLRAWKEVEEGTATYDKQKCYRICQINCFRSRDIRRTLPHPNEVLTLEKVADAIKDCSILPTFPPLKITLKVESPDGQSAPLALNRDETDDIQATHEPFDLWPHLKPGTNILTIDLESSPTTNGTFLQQKGQSHVDHLEENDGYIFVLQTTEPAVGHSKLVSLRLDPFYEFRIKAMTCFTQMTKIKTALH